MKRNELSIFDPGFDLFDPFFPDEFFRREEKAERNLLKTDVVENENNYELTMDVPGLSKEDVNIHLENGYLTIAAHKSQKEDETKKHFVRKERYYYEAKRTFYVGDINENDITAKIENGELLITVPKEQEKKETRKQITIQ